MRLRLLHRHDGDVARAMLDDVPREGPEHGARQHPAAADVDRGEALLVEVRDEFLLGVVPGDELGLEVHVVGQGPPGMLQDTNAAIGLEHWNGKWCGAEKPGQNTYVEGFHESERIFEDLLACFIKLLVFFIFRLLVRVFHCGAIDIVLLDVFVLLGILDGVDEGDAIRFGAREETGECLGDEMQAEIVVDIVDEDRDFHGGCVGGDECWK
mmetsp:Transcript_21981/g.54344  ORF Transcript_21981/g.54344 Transcript_21981/m.54344 type:complete len:211 (+) Transcript_21981:405-1037(+)